MALQLLALETGGKLCFYGHRAPGTETCAVKTWPVVACNASLIFAKPSHSDRPVIVYCAPAGDAVTKAAVKLAAMSNSMTIGPNEKYFQDTIAITRKFSENKAKIGRMTTELDLTTDASFLSHK